VAKSLCSDIGDGTQPGKLSADRVEQLRSSLVSTKCDGSDLDPPDGTTPLSKRLADQRDAWQQLATDFSSNGGATSTSGRVRDLQQQLGQLRTALTAAGSALPDDTAALRTVADSINKAHDGAAQLDTDTKTLLTQYTAAKAQLDTALATAADENDKSIKPAIARVVAQGQQSSDDLGKAFDASADGLGSAADALRDGTARTLKKQQQDLADQEKSDEAGLNDKTKAGLSSISGNVTSATRDIDSTRTSLTKDLNNVLLDLGDPKDPGKGLLGTLGKSARAADSADYQLGLASDSVSSYASVRSQEVGGILLRQAQAEAALQRQAELPAFATELPAGTAHRTVYLFHLGGDR
jgi:hypothetical protein